MTVQFRYEMTTRWQLILSLIWDLTNEIFIENHPIIELSQRKLNNQNFRYDLKNRNLPDLCIIYYNQSLRDIDAHRYNVVAIGIGIPILQADKKPT